MFAYRAGLTFYMYIVLPNHMIVIGCALIATSLVATLLSDYSNQQFFIVIIMSGKCILKVAKKLCVLLDS